MSAVSLEQKIRVAAAADPTLLSLLCSGPSKPFRWCTQGHLIQGIATPAVVTQLISNPSMNVAAGRMPTSWARVQFTIWAGQYTAGAQAAEDVAAALKAFLNTLNLDSVDVASDVACANYVANERDTLYPQTDTPVYQKIIDAMIWSNDTLTS